MRGDDIETTEQRQPKDRLESRSFALLVRYNPLSKIPPIFPVATYVLFDTMRRDRQIVSRRESDRYTSVVQGRVGLRLCI